MIGAPRDASTSAPIGSENPICWWSLRPLQCSFWSHVPAGRIHTRERAAADTVLRIEWLAHALVP
jgi:hypothetical protein